MPTERRVEKMTRVLKYRQPDLTVICENIHDPHNVSAILRSCDAVGVEEINLLYTNQPFPKMGKKSSASARKWIGINRFTDAANLKKHLDTSNFTIYATHLTANSTSLYDIDWTEPAAIIVGNEHAGVSDDALAIADKVVHIPMQGMIQSLNVSVATAVILYEACRQRIISGKYPHPDLTAEKLTSQLQEWVEK